MEILVKYVICFIKATSCYLKERTVGCIKLIVTFPQGVGNVRRRRYVLPAQAIVIRGNCEICIENRYRDSVNVLSLGHCHQVK